MLIVVDARAELIDYDSTAGLRIAPEVKAAINSGVDSWGEKSMQQPEGPTFEFFKNATAPMRYCDAEFLHYPIVLSAPGAARKSRVISNGSAINGRANRPRWKEVGTPVKIYVGDNAITFGQDLRQLDGPKYAHGYLPIVQLSYRDGNTSYYQEVFGGTDAALAKHAVTFARFSTAGANGTITAQLDTTGSIRSASIVKELDCG